MSLTILKDLEDLSKRIDHSKEISEARRCSNIIDCISLYIRDPCAGLDIYSAADLDIQLFRARAEDIARLRENNIVIDELKRKLYTQQARADHFETQSADYAKCLKLNQSEIASLSLTVHKHQRNSEAAIADKVKLEMELQELKTLNSNMASSISENQRSSIVENATVRAELESSIKSSRDYKAAFMSTKKKLQLYQKRHQDLFSMADPSSPMGLESDTSSLTWNEDGLSASVSHGSLLATDGTASSVRVTLLPTAKTSISFTSDLDLDDLSDKACLL